MIKPILRNGIWFCGKCGAYIDTGFIERPRRCDGVGCGILIDWS